MSFHEKPCQEHGKLEVKIAKIEEKTNLILQSVSKIEERLYNNHASFMMLDGSERSKSSTSAFALKAFGVFLAFMTSMIGAAAIAVNLLR